MATIEPHQAHDLSFKEALSPRFQHLPQVAPGEARMLIRRLEGEQPPAGYAVLRYSADKPLDGDPAFYIRSGLFNLKRVQVTHSRKMVDHTRVRASAAMVNELYGRLRDKLLLDQTALPIVTQLLGYDPSIRAGNIELVRLNSRFQPEPLSVPLAPSETSGPASRTESGTAEATPAQRLVSDYVPEGSLQPTTSNVIPELRARFNTIQETLSSNPSEMRHALRTLLENVEAHEDAPQWWFILAGLEQRLNHPAAALEAYRRALAHGLNAGDTCLDRANVSEALLAVLGDASSDSESDPLVLSWLAAPDKWDAEPALLLLAAHAQAVHGDVEQAEALIERRLAPTLARDLRPKNVEKLLRSIALDPARKRRALLGLFEALRGRTTTAAHAVARNLSTPVRHLTDEFSEPPPRSQRGGGREVANEFRRLLNPNGRT